MRGKEQIRKDSINKSMLSTTVFGSYLLVMMHWKRLRNEKEREKGKWEMKISKSRVLRYKHPTHQDNNVLLILSDTLWPSQNTVTTHQS